MLCLDADVLRDLDRSRQLEWLETNGLGGWSSSTVVGLHTRRYHGLFVPALDPPVQRMVLLSRLDEAILRAEDRADLGCSQFPGTIHPRGYEYLVSFVRDIFPTFLYEADGTRIQKRIGALHGRNAVLVDYLVEAAPRAFSLELRPFLAGRDVHDLRRLADTDIRLRPRHAQFAAGTLRIAVPLVGELEIRIFAPRASFVEDPDWWLDFEYEEERQRGYDYREDLWTPGVLNVPAFAGDRITVLISMGSLPEIDPAELWAEEETRRQLLLAPGADPTSPETVLLRAADQFLTRRSSRSRTIIAGYPWFSDWGRDAMISLPGLCLVTGRHREAREILRTFVEHVSGGLIPNRFLENGGAPEYNTADASLWLFWSVYKYLQYTGDSEFVREEMLGVLREIVAAHLEGTSFGIGVDTDGFLTAGEPGVQLTWMDARVEGRVITPRMGKPVEVNALWINALFVLAEFENLLGSEAEAARLTERVRSTKRKFQARFWNPVQQCLHDVIDGPEGDDPTVRPNQIFALSLVTPLLTRDRARKVLSVVEQQLVTPFGLRSLAPDDPRYHGEYTGGAAARDAAYHQGTVWSWLAGPYVTALVRFGGRSGRSRARAYLENLATAVASKGERARDQRCLGTLPELFDGDWPHAPRGAVAQAWSVGEWLRAWHEDVVDG